MKIKAIVAVLLKRLRRIWEQRFMYRYLLINSETWMLVIRPLVWYSLIRHIKHCGSTKLITLWAGPFIYSYWRSQ